MGYRKPYYDENHKLHRYGIGDAVRDIFSFLTHFFAPSNVMHAFRSVISGFRGYVSFFAAMLVIQSFFWIIWDVTDAKTGEILSEAGDTGCSMIIEGFDSSSWADYFNRNFYLNNGLPENVRGYVSVVPEEYTDAKMKEKIRVRVLLNDNSEEGCSQFLHRYPLADKKLSVSYTRLVSADTDAGKLRASSVSVTVLAGVLAVGLMVVLFIIRTNQYKFTYGVYMAFGAGFEKLLETTAWELFAIGIITAIPAYLLAMCAKLIFYGTKTAFVLTVGRVLAAFAWMLSVIFLSVIPAVRIISARTPLKMISAGDNSNYVSSPRRSFRIFGRNFPYHYELYGFVRYRKYYAAVLLASSLFTTAFCSGLFIADMKNTSDQALRPQFVLSSESADLGPAALRISGNGNVGFVLWDECADATALSAHVRLSRRQATGNSGSDISIGHGLYADNSFRFSRITPELVSEIRKGGAWKITGDLGSVLSNENTVCVSQEIGNRKKMNFRVGDKITLAVPSADCIFYPIEKNDRRFALSVQVEEYRFDYYEVTVGAVIEEPFTTGTYMIGLPDALFGAAVGERPGIREISVFPEERGNTAAAEKVRNAIAGILPSDGSVTVTDTFAAQEYSVSEKVPVSRALLFGAFGILFMTPVVWFFSQKMFVSKRKTEIYMLSAMGADRKRLSELFLFSGGVLAGIGCAVTGLIVSFLTSFVYRHINYHLPSLGFGEGTVYTYRLPAGGLVISMIVAAACAVAATWLPFRACLRENEEARSPGSAERGDA